MTAGCVCGEGAGAARAAQRVELGGFRCSRGRQCQSPTAAWHSQAGSARGRAHPRGVQLCLRQPKVSSSLLLVLV